jgi:amidase
VGPLPQRRRLVRRRCCGGGRGAAPFAQGSDGGGSIRIPASACGLFGIKPSRGRVSNGPLNAEVSGLAVMGPLARTVRDAAAMLDAMAGPMPGDPFWAAPPATSFLAAADRAPGRLRVGRYADPVLGHPLDPQCRAAYDGASALLETLGHEVVDIPRPYGDELLEPFKTVWSSRRPACPCRRRASTSSGALTPRLRDRGLADSAVEFNARCSRCALASRQAIVATSGFDAVPDTDARAAAARRRRLPQRRRPRGPTSTTRSPFTPFTAPYNMSGSRRSASRCTGRRPACPSGSSWSAGPRRGHAGGAVRAAGGRSALGRPRPPMW